MDVDKARSVFVHGSEAARADLCDVLCTAGPKAHDALLVLASDSETEVRRYATWALGRADARTPALDAALVTALRDEDGEVRAIAVDGVRSSQVQDASVPPTLVALMDDDEVGETRAFLALEGLEGAEVAIPRATLALREGRPSAYGAMRLLLTLDEAGTEVSQAVQAGLEHSSPTVQSLAQRWLERAC